ncbi:MAG: hypothetical protein QNJ94_24065 [Alphaproteobacteria bacterium]|nr:hypothetical protein [Alphaproteobacteria bacterium]
MASITLHRKYLGNAKWAFTTRRVAQTDAQQVLAQVSGARPGDLLLARVESIGHHKGVQLATGRRSILYLGDEVVVCVGNRYAPDQFEAAAEIDPAGCDLVAAGGLAGRMVHKHGAVASPTRLQPIGLVADGAGKPLNVADYALEPASPGVRVPVFAVLGTSMNAGKTTTAAGLVHGLTRAGLRVGAAKITGTGACADFNAFEDAGAHAVLDFTDAGHVSTHKVELAELHRIQDTLIAHLLHAGCAAIVLEVADGLFQGETRALMRSEPFRSSVDGVLFAASDAMSAVGGAQLLRQTTLELAGISGLVSRSPLACQEVSAATDVPVYGSDDLTDPVVAAGLVYHFAKDRSEAAPSDPAFFSPAQQDLAA